MVDDVRLVADGWLASSQRVIASRFVFIVRIFFETFEMFLMSFGYMGKGVSKNNKLPSSPNGQ